MMKYFHCCFVLILLLPKLLFGQPKRNKLDSFDKLRQGVLLQYIGQLGGKDSVGLYQRNVHYFYHEFSPYAQSLTPVQEAEMIKNTIKSGKRIIDDARTYCNCQSAADIGALPFRYFKRSDPELYQSILTDNFWGPALNSTAFLVFCPGKGNGKRKAIAAVWFWPGAQIAMTSSVIPERR